MFDRTVACADTPSGVVGVIGLGEATGRNSILTEELTKDCPESAWPASSMALAGELASGLIRKSSSKSKQKQLIPPTALKFLWYFSITALLLGLITSAAVHALKQKRHRRGVQSCQRVNFEPFGPSCALLRCRCRHAIIAKGKNDNVTKNS